MHERVQMEWTYLIHTFPDVDFVLVPNWYQIGISNLLNVTRLSGPYETDAR